MPTLASWSFTTWALFTLSPGLPTISSVSKPLA